MAVLRAVLWSCLALLVAWHVSGVCGQKKKEVSGGAGGVSLRAL